MNNDIYREKSIEKISTPEDLSDYLRVTTPAMWAMLVGIAIAVIGIFVWSYFMSISSYAYGTAVVENGYMTVTFENRRTARNVTEDMDVIVGNIPVHIDSVGRDVSGNVIAVAKTDIPDGDYEAKACYRQTKLISLLFE